MTEANLLMVRDAMMTTTIVAVMMTMSEGAGTEAVKRSAAAGTRGARLPGAHASSAAARVLLTSVGTGMGVGETIDVIGGELEMLLLATLPSWRLNKLVGTVLLAAPIAHLLLFCAVTRPAPSFGVTSRGRWKRRCRRLPHHRPGTVALFVTPRRARPGGAPGTIGRHLGPPSRWCQRRRAPRVAKLLQWRRSASKPKRRCASARRRLLFVH